MVSEIDSLKKDYKKVLNCKKCKKNYGTDFTKDDGYCPKCSLNKNKGRKKTNGNIRN